VKNSGFKLEKFSEAYTSENWNVRIYKVNKMGNRESVEITQPIRGFPKSIPEFK